MIWQRFTAAFTAPPAITGGTTKGLQGNFAAVKRRQRPDYKRNSASMVSATYRSAHAYDGAFTSASRWFSRSPRQRFRRLKAWLLMSTVPSHSFALPPSSPFTLSLPASNDLASKLHFFALSIGPLVSTLRQFRCANLYYVYEVLQRRVFGLFLTKLCNTPKLFHSLHSYSSE